MAKSVPAPDKTFAAGKYATALNATAAQWPTTAAWTYGWPYNANVVWQDTSSNATYCSVSSALSLSQESSNT